MNTPKLLNATRGLEGEAEPSAEVLFTKTSTNKGGRELRLFPHAPMAGPACVPPMGGAVAEPVQ